MELPIIGITLFALALTTGNWLLSLYFARKEEDYFLVDVKRLLPASIPFLKTQWPFLFFCFAGTGCAQYFRHGPGIASTNSVILPTIAGLVSIGLLPILKLFYVSYLGSERRPGLVASLGVWSVILFILTDTLRISAGYAGLFLFVVPGLIISLRTSLILPCFALGGHKPIEAFKRSWSLTEGHYWLASRYLGLPAVIVSLTNLPSIFASQLHSADHQIIHFMSTISALTMVISMIVTVLYAGLLYQLYDRLSTEESQTIT